MKASTIFFDWPRLFSKRLASTLGYIEYAERRLRRQPRPNMVTFPLHSSVTFTTVPFPAKNVSVHRYFGGDLLRCEISQPRCESETGVDFDDGGKLTDRLIITIWSKRLTTRTLTYLSLCLAHRSVINAPFSRLCRKGSQDEVFLALFQNTSLLFHWLSRSIGGLRLGDLVFSTRSGPSY